jgi:nicotinamidase-related amidase
MPLVRRADSVLAVVDTQPGFVDHPAMGAAERTEAARTVERIAWLARLAVSLDVPALATEEEPQREGHTHARVKACLPPDAPVVPKKTFAFTGCDEALATLRATERRIVVLTGFETDVCVAQSAVALIDAGYRVVVPADATYTAREVDHHRGIARMSAAGVEIHSSKSVTYEWLEDVDTAAAILERASAEFDVLPYRL